MAVLLGVLVAMGYGTGDFIGARASMRTSTAAVLLVSQAVTLVGALVLVFVVAGDPGPADLALGASAGAASVMGLGLLYRGLATAAMGVVAPIAAAVGAMVPVVWGLANGERPSAITLAGVVLTISAGALIARQPGPSSAVAPGIAIAAAAGLVLGSSLVLYSETGEDSGMWPLLSARICAVILAAIGFAWMARRGARLPAGSARAFAMTAGAFEITATALLVLAVREGLVSVVAGIAALAPGFTVLLAWGVLHEHLSIHQRVGLVVALVGLVLVAAG